MRLASIAVITALLSLFLGQAAKTEQTGHSHHAHHNVDSSSVWAKCHALGARDPKLAPTDVPTAEQKKVLVNILASRHHRVSHALWHTTRSELTAAEQKLIEDAYGWKNPHLECPFLPENPYGSDFLYMHRIMVNDWQNALMSHVNEKGEPEPLPCVGAWPELPGLDNESWPVPGKKVGVKSDAALTILKDWAAAFRDPEWLKLRTLSEVGFVMEVSLHNNMHMRWTEDTPMPRYNSGAELPLNGSFADDWIFDEPEYDWLADPYGAHLNPHFWKLHGLVDLVVDLWAKAHGYTKVGTKAECEAVAGDTTQKCYVWTGTWVGGAVDDRETLAARGLVKKEDVRKAEETLFEKRLKGQTRGVLTKELLKEEQQKPLSKDLGVKSWPNDPYEFVKRRFCIQ